MYRHYQDWSVTNGYKATAAHKFGEELGRTFPDWATEMQRRKKGKKDESRLTEKRTINGKRVPVYSFLRESTEQAERE
jgi:hypothetical protein